MLSAVLRFTREGWPPKKSDEGSDMQRVRQLADSLAVCNGCLLLRNGVVTLSAMRRQVLDYLHRGHFGMQRMKQLAWTAVYWPSIDDDIEAACRNCMPCGEHQNTKPVVHPWMLPEKPWSAFTWTTRSTSWDPTGWCMWTPTPNTPTSTQRSPSPLKLRLIYWKRTSPTSDIPTRWSTTTRHPSCPKNSSTQ